MLCRREGKKIFGGMRNYQEKLIKSYEQLQIESHHVSRAERKFFSYPRYAMHCREFYIAVNRYASIGNRKKKIVKIHTE